MTRHDATDPMLAFARHDHSHCAGDLIARAEALATERGARLTPVRRRVLEILLESHRALGAYDLLDRLAADGFGRQPPVAYRALDFLAEQGLVHRIAQLNAYMACTHPGEAHTPAVLICRACHAVAEDEGAPVHAAVATATERSGFRAERVMVEVIGLCPACQEAGHGAH